MGTVYRTSELSKVPQDAKFDNSYWHYFLILEEDFKNTLRYIYLTESHFDTYSAEYAKQLISISMEFETICKLLCQEIDKDSKPGNIGQYKKIILSKFPKIWSTPIYIDQQGHMKVFPLEEWEEEGGKLRWWADYNDIKHTRHLHFKKATLKNTLYALGSLLILESYLYKLAYPAPSSYRFGTTLLRVPELAEHIYYPKGTLPDFNI